MKRGRKPGRMARRKKERRIGPLAWTVFALGGVTAAALLYLCLFTGVFAIEEVAMHGAKNLSLEDLNLTGEKFVGGNIFSVSLQEVRKQLMNHAQVRDVTFKRRFFHRLDCYIRQREPVALIVLDRIAEVDAEGVIIPVSTEASDIDLPVITGMENTDPHAAEGARQIGKALEILDLLKTYGFSPARHLSEIHIESEDVILVWMDTGTLIQMGKGGYQEKVNKLRAVYSTLNESEVFPHHIDLRFDKQVVIR
ncbi:MAG: cell division protein FtsQ/DivIB [Candidatus Krumholzibacteriota bacterium]|nr:cell division protein FtsQ/DivIB [Candidatus Krumholzibacteriota bacterium]